MTASGGSGDSPAGIMSPTSPSSSSAPGDLFQDRERAKFKTARLWRRDAMTSVITRLRMQRRASGGNGPEPGVADGRYIEADEGGLEDVLMVLAAREGRVGDAFQDGRVPPRELLEGRVVPGPDERGKLFVRPLPEAWRARSWGGRTRPGLVPA